MDDFPKKVYTLMLQNRRSHKGHVYTLPSPTSYPYQWFWDSCFHAIILSYFSPSEAKDELRSLTAKQFENGMIPHMIYWQKKTEVDFPIIHWGKKDTSTITQPPLLAHAVWHIYQKDSDKQFLEEMYPSLARLYQYFLTQRDPHEMYLISVINPDESGEDNSPRFDIPLNLPPRQTLEENFRKRLQLVEDNRKCNFDAPFCMKNFFWVKDVPMNAILHENLVEMGEIAEELGEKEDALYYAAEAKKIATAMRKWMLEGGIFWPIYYNTASRTYEKMKVKTWAMFAPLFAGILTQKEADTLIHTYLLGSHAFKTRFSVPTVALSDPSFNQRGFWRGPVWMSVNWFVVKGLQRYGYTDLAATIKAQSLELVHQSGFREYFDPLTGDGLGAKQFTWSGLILDM